jgi:predicted amidophosphoribosyltransferase
MKEQCEAPKWKLKLEWYPGFVLLKEIKCHKCGETNRPIAKYCAYCGEKLRSVMADV